MKVFSVEIDNPSFQIEQGIHEGFYSVSCRNQSALLGKDDKGLWVFSMQTSEPLGVEAGKLGEAIEKVLI